MRVNQQKLIELQLPHEIQDFEETTSQIIILDSRFDSGNLGSAYLDESEPRKVSKINKDSSLS